MTEYLDDDFEFDLDFSLDGIETIESPEKVKPDEKQAAVHRRAGHRHLTRKAASEQALLNTLNWHFEPGECYHCFSFGDVDSISYFKHVLRQQRVKYLALSTWCMAAEDVKDLRDWWKRGMIGRVDFYVGEIFQGSYSEVYDMICAFARECGGRVVVFRNHAKVMAVVGERFDCLIESSANVNTNPRSENTVLTVDSTLVADYVKLFNGIVPFNREFRDAPVYEIPERKDNG